MEYEIVIKPTGNKKASFGLQANGLMKYVGGHGLNGLGVGRMYEMYFISNDHITGKTTILVPEKDAYYRIIATTEEKLQLPLISKVFLETFINEYNNKHLIEKVFLSEYTETSYRYGIDFSIDLLHLKDGYVNIEKFTFKNKFTKIK